MIEIYLLEQLAAVAKYGTLSAAAEHLHLAQPSLSRSMQKLEDLLGVTLFERKKNRIELNDTGRLAADYANHLLRSEEEMILRIQNYDKNLRTLAIGSCAPGPLMVLLPEVAAIFPELTISSGLDTEEKLLSKLEESAYHIIVLPHPIDSPELICREYCSEQLYLTVNRFHPAATYNEISFAEADGQNYIMYAHVGFWDTVVREKMPHSKFFLQNDMEALGELARYSDLPSFSTDITQRLIGHKDNRLNIPFTDKEAHVSYYLISPQKSLPKLKNLFESINVSGHL